MKKEDLNFVKETLEWVAENMECKDPRMHETFYNLYANSFNIINELVIDFHTK